LKRFSNSQRDVQRTQGIPENPTFMDRKGGGSANTNANVPGVFPKATTTREQEQNRQRGDSTNPLYLQSI